MCVYPFTGKDKVASCLSFDIWQYSFADALYPQPMLFSMYVIEECKALCLDNEYECKCCYLISRLQGYRINCLLKMSTLTVQLASRGERFVFSHKCTSFCTDRSRRVHSGSFARKSWADHSSGQHHTLKGD
ncbi:TPA: hypothetical protein ACH3X2_009678 [Trebouxia sp. C0005]